ncbi:Rap1a/Tai family immunity protein [uncultured Sphingomonas sp.]|uniref:Rap1a/Tai family immunity protein n=1 Tax=uncultured Sphingomonas sp. TaxID=158754 RepID=UPI0025F5749F|nr:Rap1a/Tai family immunity protein [uncultured Sphingomonas sp.]
MKTKLLAAAAAAFLAVGGCFTPSPASADFKDGNELLAKCTTEKSDSVYYQNTAYCIAYIAGAVDMFTTWQMVGKAPQCMPDNATAGQIRDVVVKYLQDHPTKRAEPGSLLVASALLEGFNCKLTAKAQ